MSLSTNFGKLLTCNNTFREVLEVAASIASSKASVLILGETGTGKELLAKEIHRRSKRKGRFVAANCSAIPETLIESELFGHVKGAFTGANQTKIGLFVAAENGTMFLDEIGHMPWHSQTNLLRALQVGKSRPVGGVDEQHLKARVIAATNVDLDQASIEGGFRADLLYRLDVIRLEIPPLRSRPEDIPLLMQLFFAQQEKEHQMQRPKLTQDAMDYLCQFPWSGNARQLENIAERLVLTKSQQTLDAKQIQNMLPLKFSSAKVNPPIFSQEISNLSENVTLDEFLRTSIDLQEKLYLTAKLKDYHGAVGLTAEAAGVSRRTLLRKMKAHGLDKADFKKV